AVETLAIKCKRALKQTGHSTIVVAGGVSANKALRTRLDAIPNARVYYPRPEFCGDNGAMIAFAGAMRQSAMVKQTVPTFSAKPRWSLNELSPP
ncbi:MAG: tRNA (adenosine(37)-N6)-threonylcarbamoyltransferase complex transferase subunit TsaD, partial [Gammaproteobacteria bacterium]|nr:tRNA (adenosine(37)-N6)-threonylcarbamoyltransferase complex transferase subunit TsaD [Gammaproteobacteria bacterium]